MPIDAADSSRPRGGRGLNRSGGAAPTSVEQQAGDDDRRRRTGRSGAKPARGIRSTLTSAPYDNGPSNTLDFSDGPRIASSSSRTLDEDDGPAPRGQLKMTANPKLPPSRKIAPFENKPQHRNASQKGATKQSAIDLSDDEDQDTTSSPAAQRDAAALDSSTTSIHSQAPMTATPLDIRPRRALAMTSAPPAPAPALRPASGAKRRSPPSGSDSDLGIPAARRRTSMANDIDPDSTVDELDLLGPHNDSPAAKRREEISLARRPPQGIKDRMRDKNNSRDSHLGQVPSKTLGAQAKGILIHLTCLVFGDQKVLTADARPTLSLPLKSSRHLRLSFSLAGRERSLDIQFADCSSIEIADNAQLEVLPMMQLKVNTSTSSAIAISQEIPFFDPRNFSSAILCRSDTSHAKDWTSLSTLIRSSVAGTLIRLGPPAIRAILETHQRTIDNESSRRKKSDEMQRTEKLPRTSLSRYTSSPSPPPFLDVRLDTRKKTAVDSKLREEGPHASVRGNGNHATSPTTSIGKPIKTALVDAAASLATRRKQERAPTASDSDAGMEPPQRFSRGDYAPAPRTTRSSNRNAATGATGAKDELLLRYPLEGPKSVSLFRSDLARLDDGQFLNDTIIEFGLKQILEQLKQRDPALYDSLYVFNSFFYGKLAKAKPKADDAYQQVRKWTSKFDVFSKKYLVIPINESMHWYLAIVVNPGRALDHLEDTQELSISPEPPVAPQSATRPRSSSANPRRSPSPAVSTPTPPPDRHAPPDQSASTSIPVDDSPGELRASTPIADLAVRDKIDSSMSPLSTPSPIAANSPSADTTPGHQVEQAAGSIWEKFRQTMDLDPEPMSAVNTPEPSSSKQLVPSALQNHVFQSPPLTAAQGALQASPPALPSALDTSSGILNEGRGSTLGGGPGPSSAADGTSRKKPVSITPGDSLNRAILRSPPTRPQYGSSSRSKGRTLNEGSAAPTKSFYGLSRPRATEFSSASRRVSLSPDPPSTSINASSSSRRKLAISRDSSDSDDVNVDVKSGRTLYIERRKEQAAEKVRAKLDDLAVLTFDSLGSAHPAVKTAVLHWLRNEAWDKKKLRIAPKVEYVNVAVPAQSNFCDCGLYVLLYFERFFRDPQKFLSTTIPMRDSSKEAWDAKSAGMARSVLRSTVNELSSEFREKREAEEAAAAAAAAAAATLASADATSANGEAADAAKAEASSKQDEQDEEAPAEDSLASIIETSSGPGQEVPPEGKQGEPEAEADKTDKMDVDPDEDETVARRPVRPQDSDVDGDLSADAEMEPVRAESVTATAPRTSKSPGVARTSKSAVADAGADAGAAEKAMDSNNDDDDDFIATMGKEVEQAYERGKEHKNGHVQEQGRNRDEGQDQGQEKMEEEGGGEGVEEGAGEGGTGQGEAEAKDMEK